MAICVEHNIFGALFVISGTAHSLSEGWMVHLNSTAQDDILKSHAFKHPFFVQCFQFFGQLFCLLLYGIVFGRCGSNNSRDLDINQPIVDEEAEPGQPAAPLLDLETPDTEPVSKWKWFIWIFCAVCDIAQTGLLFIGLKLAFPGSTMMFRGSVLFFTALLSIAFLVRNLPTKMWLGIWIAIIGMTFVGMPDFIFGNYAAYDKFGLAAGSLLLILAQVAVATRVVLEQKFIIKYHVHPLLAVGLEGLYGLILSVILLIGFYYVPAGAFSQLPTNRLADALDAFNQIKTTWQIALALIGNSVSISFFYYFGIDFARKHGPISRMVLNNIVSIMSWSVFIGFQWQIFHWIQVFGFIFILVGTFVYAGIIVVPIWKIICRTCCPNLIRNTSLEDDVPLMNDRDVLVYQREVPIQTNGPNNQVI